ncbi:class I SAM-dependent methyltransferase [Candidatus Mycobacterium methanotrophicum]|uniref:Class I SAM-dependent methyltransferase n=1 Tax=Candidatus Mycobacterium methanotrophicum TaxID=2943498 RepID=A0ABY4QKS1_9MYCO|nr:class I SAM-dependent methyltransferase [Candidatus Mycobacterium methanotrophicum]UQX10576.1 class I SAM-dependent methyltransferase [Candidatus Mycobacterium methanotrophicum]
MTTLETPGGSPEVEQRKVRCPDEEGQDRRMAVEISGVTLCPSDDLITAACLDRPRTGPVDGYAFEVDGWVVSKAPVAEVEFVHEQTVLASCALTVSRPDVAEVYGSSSSPAGFSKAVETVGLAPVFTVGVRVVLQDGRRRAIAEIRGRQSIQRGAGPVHDFDDATHSFRMLGVPYDDFLTALHTHLTPRTYLEVGTETGTSLALAGCDAIAVDPQFQLAVTATGNRRRTFFFQMPSDTFFATENVRQLLGRPVDMVFLDGMHRFEFLLRDLIGTEAACHPRSLILLHDCVPLNPRMALRQWLPGESFEKDTAGMWTGDVWKLLPILKKYRPDLRLHVLDCPPTGLVAVTRVDPASHVLADRYYDIIDEHAATAMDENRLRSLWEELQLTDSGPLCEEPDRLTELFSLY